MKRIFFVIIISIIASSVTIKADDLESTYRSNDTLKAYGVYTNYQMNMHDPGFGRFDYLPTCCYEFTETENQHGFDIGTFIEWPLPYKLKAGLKLGFSDQSASMFGFDTVMFREGNDIGIGKSKHLFNASISELAVEPYLTYRVWYGLKFSIGGRIGILMNKTYDFKETLEEPNDRGFFYDPQNPDSRLRERNIQNGDIESGQTSFASVVMGAQYELPLNKENSVQLVPSLQYSIGVTDLIKEDQSNNGIWKVNNFRAGVAFKFYITPEKKKEEYETNEYIDTVKVVKPDLERIFVQTGKTRSIDKKEERNGKLYNITEVYRTDTLFVLEKPEINISSNTDLIQIKTQFVTETFPLLPIIFFDKDSEKLASYYNTNIDKSKFDPDKLSPNPLEFNKNILNIIASRMLKNPKAKLSLKGSADSTSENSNCTLARNRAETVADYIVDVWGINPNRIRIVDNNGQCAPANATKTPIEEAYADNRRVEIYTNVPDLFDPIVRKKFKQVTDISPKELILNLKGLNEKSTKKWELIGKQRTGEKILMNSKDMVEEVKINIDKEKALDFISDNQLLFEVYTEDKAGQTAMDRKTIKVEEETSEIEVHRMSLVLFDVGSDKISALAQQSIKKFIKDLNSQSSVRVFGYTDNIGDKDKNQDLSARRAQNTAEIILQLEPYARIDVIKGVADTKYPPGIDSYKTPAARFLSRTVQIEILSKRK